jgi:hypothetical protein
MTTTTIKSTKSGNEYTLYLNSKKQAIACSCPSRRFNPSKPCKHMNAHNTEIEMKSQSMQARKDAQRTNFNYYELSLGA